MFAKLGKELGIRYYGLLSASGAKANSMFLYMRVKGRVENAVRELEIPYFVALRPGLLLNRDNDKRLGEKILSWIPLITRIQSSQLGKVMLDHAVIKARS